MPLLLLLVVPLLMLALWALLLPVALVQRYRSGRARRRAVRWAMGLNGALLLVSTALFVFAAWVSGHWVDMAVPYAAAGWIAGALVGAIGVALTRVERGPDAVWFTPNRWLVLGLTLVVAARIGVGLVRAWQAWHTEAHVAWLAGQGSLLAVGGGLLGYYLAYNWGMRRRLFRD
jgi:hypothetical protein